jgi:hypothetical protein
MVACQPSMYGHCCRLRKQRMFECSAIVRILIVCNIMARLRYCTCHYWYRKDLTSHLQSRRQLPRFSVHISLTNAVRRFATKSVNLVPFKVKYSFMVTCRISAYVCTVRDGLNLLLHPYAKFKMCIYGKQDENDTYMEYSGLKGECRC